MEVPTKGFVLLSLVSLLSLLAMGCDNQSGMEDNCPGDISILSAPSNLSLFIGEGGATLRIGSDTLAFNHSADRDLTYFVNASASDILDARIVGSDTLIVMPRQVGEASIEVKARDACGQFQTVSFTVEVLDACIETPGDITARSVPPDMLLYAGEETATLRIGSDTLAFQHTLGRPLSYSVSANPAEFAATTLYVGSDPLFVELTPRMGGQAQVEVVATDACGVAETVAFTVEVVDVCTIAAEQPDAVYFPIHVGNAWTYAYRRDSQNRSHPNYLTEGTLTWEVASATACQDGRQGFSIQETIEGVTNPSFDL